VKLRWRRLGSPGGGERFNLQLLAERLELVLQELEGPAAAVAIIDSIQKRSTTPKAQQCARLGWAQVRDCAAALAAPGQAPGTRPLLRWGHVTKEAWLAGPKVLELWFDAVLTSRCDRFASHRLLRAVKNRFGRPAGTGVFEWRDRGSLK